MKKYRNVFYCCRYVLAAVTLAVIVLADLPSAVDIGLSVLFASLFSVSHIQLLHDRMMKKDRDYQVAVMDERNIAIQEKTGNITCMILTCLLGLATVVFIGMELFIPAVITGGIVAVEPVVMIVVSTVLEKRI